MADSQAPWTASLTPRRTRRRQSIGMRTRCMTTCWHPRNTSLVRFWLAAGQCSRLHLLQLQLCRPSWLLLWFLQAFAGLHRPSLACLISTLELHRLASGSRPVQAWEDIRRVIAVPQTCDTCFCRDQDGVCWAEEAPGACRPDCLSQGGHSMRCSCMASCL